MTDKQSEWHIQNVLKPLEEFENQMGKLYRWLHEKFRDDDEAAFVFYRLNLDEKAHASIIQYQRRLVQQNPRMFKKIEFDIEDLNRTSARVDHFMDRKRLALEEAVNFSLELEGSAAEMHLRTALQQSIEGLARLLGSLGSADRFHVELLRSLAVKKGFLKEGEGQR